MTEFLVKSILACPHCGVRDVRARDAKIRRRFRWVCECGFKTKWRTF